MAGIQCRVSIDGGVPQPITAAPTVIIQGVNSAAKPVRIRRIQLQSNNSRLTSQSLLISYGFYTNGATTGGSTPVGVPVEAGLVGIYTPATAFKAITTQMGVAPFFPRYSWQWNTGDPFDPTFTPGAAVGRAAGKAAGLDEGTRVSTVWAFILPQGPATGFSLTGTLEFDEEC
jgi:hypothetical protein